MVYLLMYDTNTRWDGHPVTEICTPPPTGTAGVDGGVDGEVDGNVGDELDGEVDGGVDGEIDDEVDGGVDVDGSGATGVTAPVGRGRAGRATG